MPDLLTLKVLSEAVTGTASAFRCRVKLQPAGGEGTKIFPPTYAGAVYATEKRRLPGHDQPVECVLLDSVQSQANRMEDALQQAVDTGRLSLPIVEVDFSPYFPGDDQQETMRLLDPVGKVSSLQVPHRIADAILRDSLCDGKPFRDSKEGKRIGTVTARNATALFELCPTALVFGIWDSTGPKGGLGAKFERAMVAEIVGIDAVYGVKTSSRIDPLGIQKDAGPLYRRADGGYTLDPAEAIDELKDGKPTGKKLLYKLNSKGEGVPHDPAKKEFADQGRPSVANHGNVTPAFGKYTKGAEGRDPLAGPEIDLKYNARRDDDAFDLSAKVRETIREAREGRLAPGGVTIRHAEQTIVLSLPALRRLRFPVGGESGNERDDAARTVLAALGLCAAALAAEAGLDLRSRCLLWPVEPLNWELLGRPGDPPSTWRIDADAAITLLKEAVDAAKSLGLPWREDPLPLTPSPDLVRLVVRSQQLSAAQGGEAGEGGA